MKKTSAFTLIEIVIALAVLIVGLVGVVAVIPMGQRSSKEAAVLTQATLVATEKIAEVKAHGYDIISQEPPPFALTGTKADIAWEVQISDVLDSDFTGFVTLPLQNLKKIIIIVSYQIKRKTRQDSYHTFVAQF